ncbi:MAG: hypothetical protein QOF33_2378 [Thermomicrobiales bacterium]|nr:hypothetical protein [Thermomicrobiales bacterium]
MRSLAGRSKPAVLPGEDYVFERPTTGAVREMAAYSGGSASLR